VRYVPIKSSRNRARGQYLRFALAKEEGVALNDEQLEAVSGGACEDNNVFPNDNGFPKKNPILPDEEKTIVPKNPTIDDRKHDIMA
jgi:hypothetical protein